MKIWIDVSNSPHVVFFRPIIRRLNEAGIETVITARDFAQTLGLLRLWNIPHTPAGRYGGRGMPRKTLGLARRSAELVYFAARNGLARKNAAQAVGHGSNDLCVAAKLLGIHSTVLHDYEGAEMMHRINFRLADKVMTPEIISTGPLIKLGLDLTRHHPYTGIKEQVSLADFEPDPLIMERLGIDPERPVATLRPPATMSLYHRSLKNTLFDLTLEHLLAAGAQIVLLPRTPEQKKELSRIRGVMVPENPVDGPSLIYASDLVVSAGGTMNREAAILGTPVYTTWAGSLGAVDRMLIEHGKLKVLRNPEEIEVKKRRKKPPNIESVADQVTREILRM